MNILRNHGCLDPASAVHAEFIRERKCWNSGKVTPNRNHAMLNSHRIDVRWLLKLQESTLYACAGLLSKWNKSWWCCSDG